MDIKIILQLLIDIKIILQLLINIKIILQLSTRVKIVHNLYVCIHTVQISLFQRRLLKYSIVLLKLPNLAQSHLENFAIERPLSSIKPPPPEITY